MDKRSPFFYCKQLVCKSKLKGQLGTMESPVTGRFLIYSEQDQTRTLFILLTFQNLKQVTILKHSLIFVLYSKGRKRKLTLEMFYGQFFSTFHI